MTKKKNVLFLYNPCSGNEKVKGYLNDIIDAIIKKGWRLEVYATQSSLDGERKIQEEGGLYDRILVSGGDGLLHEALNGLLKGGWKTPLGYIPAGTTNDFANTHQIPTDVLKALDVALSSNVKVVDSAKFNDTYFSYVAAFGIGTKASYQTGHDLKKKLGFLAYVITYLQTTDFVNWENNSAIVTLKTPDQTYYGDYTFGMISNSKYVGGSEKLVPNDTSCQDGLLECLFIKRPMNLHELNQILINITKKNFSSDFFLSFQTPSLQILGESVEWTLDGEYGGKWNDVKIECIPQALHLISK